MTSLFICSIDDYSCEQDVAWKYSHWILSERIHWFNSIPHKPTFLKSGDFATHNQLLLVQTTWYAFELWPVYSMLLLQSKPSDCLTSHERITVVQKDLLVAWTQCHSIYISFLTAANIGSMGEWLQLTSSYCITPGDLEQCDLEQLYTWCSSAKYL